MSLNFINLIRNMAILRKFIISLGLFLAASVFLLADFELTHWKFFKPIQVVGVSSKQMVSIRLDNEVISQVSSVEGELRVIEGASAEVPFDSVADSDALIEDHRANAVLLNKSVLGEEYQQFVCDLGANPQVTNQMSVESSSRDFVRRVDVAGSDDLKKWFSLAKSLHIFDWSEGRKLKLDFPDSTYRYLKVILWLDGGKPLEIQSAVVSHHERRTGELENVPFTLRFAQRVTTEKFSEWIFDFGHQHPLLNRCTFDVSNSNFRRRVSLATSDDNAMWQPGPSLEIFRTTSGAFKDEFTEIETNALNHRYLRIRVFNGDDRPLSVNAIQFQRFVRRVLFEFEPQRSYRLFYANSEAQRPSYDLTALEPLRLGKLLQGSLGSQQRNPDFLDARSRQPWSERHPRILWVVLIVVVILLAGLLLRSVKSMNAKA
jgi:hypothetical protein